MTHEVLPCRVLYHYSITCLCCEVARCLPLHWEGRDVRFRGFRYNVLFLGSDIDDGKGSAGSMLEHQRQVVKGESKVRTFW